jgi:hypothetical protein
VNGVQLAAALTALPTAATDAPSLLLLLAVLLWMWPHSLLLLHASMGSAPTVVAAGATMDVTVAAASAVGVVTGLLTCHHHLHMSVGPLLGEKNVAGDWAYPTSLLVFPPPYCYVCLNPSLFIPTHACPSSSWIL